MITWGKRDKKEFLAISSEITDNGMLISVNGKKYNIEWPSESWKKVSAEEKKLLLDNLTFTQTCHLAASHKKKGIKYNTAMPCFETFAFKATLYDAPSTAVIDHEKTIDYIRRFFNSEFVFSDDKIAMPSNSKKTKIKWKTKKSAIILFTAGKESLLNLALCMELGIIPIPVYIDEDPNGPESRHKYRIIEQFESDYGIKVHKIVNEPGKLRYCDLGEEENNWGAGTQFLTYSLAIMPFVKQYGADYVLFGNEYSCDDYIYDKEGFKSNFCFDQCTEWTKQLDVVAKTMTNNGVTVGSLVGPLYEIGLVKILHSRYPELAKLQMSCFSDTEEGKKRMWCGNCSKCARMFVFFKALGINTKSMGFENNMFNKPSKDKFSIFGKEGLYSYDVSGLGSEEQSLAFYLAAERGEKGYLIDKFRKLKAYRDIKDNMMEVYNKYFSQHESKSMPPKLKKKVMDIYAETFRGNFVPKDFRISVQRC